MVLDSEDNSRFLEAVVSRIPDHIEPKIQMEIQKRKCQIRRFGIDDIPPRKWRLGGVCELFPGDDNLVRVVAIKTQTGNMKRRVSRIVQLPTCD